ncbi:MULTISPECIES: ABC transporter substrate-binding protein [unclassified Devosia]|jgi:peptide/nickel transport system substrate-binding protein|uniref:ABC transporter substrate-binding protein n=1 Tax=unclassified Devosia TaxID=196773 RepID=UPI0023D89E62|nr:MULTISPECIES: ABC transporter substrate-binding protein [unclassified Devosia]WEJ31786.1 ABC transporter substrate-binding protein [Devosia sp. SD17-2]
MTNIRALLMAGVAVFAAPALAVAQSADTITVGISADANTFDPAAISSRDNSNIAKHIFGTLYEITPEGDIVPDLAESYVEAEDGKSYTYTLREGLVCEDGEALTAEDAAYSFNRAADPANAFTGNTPGFVYSSIQFAGAEAISEREVKINLGQKNPVSFGLIAEVFIHCKDSYEAMSLADAASTPIGSGPYKLASWDRGSQVVLERVKEDEANAQTIVWRIIPEASTRSAELIAGNVDIITNVAPDQLDAVNGSGNAEVKAVQGTRRMYVGFNQRQDFADGSEGGKAIQETAVRVALQYAVDVPAICSQLLNFECTRANGLVNPPNDNKSLEPYAYDPEMAEKLLDEAGYPRGEDGVRFEITMQAPRGRYLNDANVALAVGQYLSDIGVQTNVELLEWASVYVPLISAHDAGPMFFLGTGGGTWSPLYDMTDLSTPTAGTNYTEWDNPEWFDGWAEISAAKTDEERRVVIDRMLEVFYNDPPWLMMYFQPDFYGVSKRVDFQPRRDEKVYLFDTTIAAN